MTLRYSKILYLFLDISDLRASRLLFEDGLGFPIIEERFHPPHHRHGVVKYDGGDTIVALNLADSSFEKNISSGITTVISTSAMREADIYLRFQELGLEVPTASGNIFADVDNHRYVVTRDDLHRPNEESTSVRELRLSVDALEPIISFCTNILDLQPITRSETEAIFATGNVRLAYQLDPAAQQQRRRGCLIVFYASNIESSYATLVGRGMKFTTEVGYSQIGGTARFIDPGDNVFCLYEPSEECLSWESGAKVRDIIADARGVGSRQIDRETSTKYII